MSGSYGLLATLFRRSFRVVLHSNDVLLLNREKLKNEEFKRGDRVRAVVTQVQKGDKGSQVVISRTDPKFLSKLLELEVPEIANGNIEIKNILSQITSFQEEKVDTHVGNNKNDLSFFSSQVLRLFFMIF